MEGTTEKQAKNLRAPPFWVREALEPFGLTNYRGTTSTAKKDKAPLKRTTEKITNMQSLGSSSVDCGNITNSYNNNITLNEITVNKTDEDNQIKQCLSPLEPWDRHKSVRANRVKGVGDWLLETNDFREWSSKKGTPKHAVLFYYGHPGVGKTHFR